MRRLLFQLILLSGCAHSTPHVWVEAVAAQPDDVRTIDGVMRAFYEVVNVAPDQKRQWGRDRTLYAPWVRFVAIGAERTVFDHQAFVDDTEPLVRAGFSEQELKRTTLQYGNIAHVASSYQTHSVSSGSSRGVNFVQLYFDGQRWWVSNVVWQTEDADHPIPAALLP